MYHGPVSDVQSFFESLGFALPTHMDLPSWVQVWGRSHGSGDWRRHCCCTAKQAWIKLALSPEFLTAIHLQELTTAAGQWAFASAVLRKSWAAVNPAAAALAASGAEFMEPRPDPETGRLPYVVSLEAMRRQFWEESATGKAMMEVRSCICTRQHGVGQRLLTCTRLRISWGQGHPS